MALLSKYDMRLCQESVEEKESGIFLKLVNQAEALRSAQQAKFAAVKPDLHSDASNSERVFQEIPANRTYPEHFPNNANDPFPESEPIDSETGRQYNIVPSLKQSDPWPKNVPNATSPLF